MQFKRENCLPLVAYFNICFFWGTAHIANKLCSSAVNPILGGGVRFTIVVVLLLLWLGITNGWVKIEAKDAWHLSASSFFLFFLNTLLLLLAARRVDASITTVVLCLIPIGVITMDMLASKKQELTVKGWCGVLIGIAGVALTASKGLAKGEVDLIGLSELILSVFVWGFGTVYLKRHPVSLGLPVQVLIQSAVPAVLFLLLALISGLLKKEVLQSLELKDFVPAAYLAVTDSIMGLASYTYLLKKWKTSRVATYAYINPIVGIICSALILHENITVSKVLGMIITLLAVVIIQKDGNKEPQKQAAAGVVQ